MKKMVNEPQLIDVLDAVRYEIFASLNCHAIGKIVSFDASKQRAKIDIAYNRTVIDDVDTSKRKDYPVMADVPVVISSGGKGSLRFPISEGDFCIIFFNDRDIENFLDAGLKNPLSSDRMHSFSDGIALVGLFPNSGSLKDYSSSKTQLIHDKTKISLENKVKIENATQSLFTVLDSMVDILTNLSNGVGVAPGNPIYPALAAQVAVIKTNLSGLME